MKARFLRPPGTPGEYLADGVRLAGLLSILVGFIRFTPTDGGIIALASPALFVPRLLGVASWLDIAYGVIVLVAAWSNVLDLYTTVPGWDIVVHVVCTAVLATIIFVLLCRTGVIGPEHSGSRVPIVLVPVLGLAISAVWEMIEWFGFVFVTDEIFVAYADTIGDMAAGGLGALGAGIVLAYLDVDERSP